MERLVKEIRLYRGEDPGNGRVETSVAMRDNYWNFERAYYVWTTECVGGHNLSKNGRANCMSRNKRITQLQVLTVTEESG
jgi:hypothetical protein